MNLEKMQTAVIENMRPHFRMVEAICLKEDDFTTENLQAILMKTLLEALIIDEVTEVGQEFLDKRDETWNEVLSKMEQTILESEGLEELQSFHLNPEEIFPVEEPAQSAESNLVIYQNALDSLKDSEGVWIEPIVEEPVVEEPEVEEPVVEEPVVEELKQYCEWCSDDIVSEKDERYIRGELVCDDCESAWHEQPDGSVGRGRKEAIWDVEEPKKHVHDENCMHTHNEKPVQADSLLNWSWYLELLSMSENTEGLIALPNVLIKLHNKKLITTKRDLLDTILVSLHGEVGTDGVRQISALFDKLE